MQSPFSRQCGFSFAGQQVKCWPVSRPSDFAPNQLSISAWGLRWALSNAVKNYPFGEICAGEDFLLIIQSRTLFFLPLRAVIPDESQRLRRMKSVQRIE